MPDKQKVSQKESTVISSINKLVRFEGSLFYLISLNVISLLVQCS